jgi:hypothetical protein
MMIIGERINAPAGSGRRRLIEVKRRASAEAFLLMKRPVSYDVQPINMELTDRRHHQLYLEKERCWGSGVQHATC